MNFTLDKYPIYINNKEINAQLKLKFYYDETNNVRKILFKKNDTLNIKPEDLYKNFVLGGIVTNINEHININDLKDIINLDKTVKEIKLKYIAKGNFLEVLKSEKLELFLQWIYENNINIHYTSVNLLYWSIVDIIDSIEDNLVIQYNRELKDTLYLLIKSNLNKFLSFAYKFNYPNIKYSDEKYFLKEMINFINQTIILNDNKKNINPFFIIIIKDIFNKKFEELTFLKGKNLKIEDSFSHFYLTNLALFPMSYHCFDEEYYIQEEFKNYEFSYKNKKWENLEFKNSINDELIQISDVIVGLIGKLNEFQNTYKTFDRIIKGMQFQQIKNFTLLIGLLSKSAAKNHLFQNDISADSELLKIFEIKKFLNLSNINNYNCNYKI